MKRRMAIVLVLSMLLCGCGKEKENVHEKTSSSEKTQTTTTTTTAEAADNAAATTTVTTANGEVAATSIAASDGNASASASAVGDNSKNIPWFSPSVYEGRIDGVTKVRYVFDTLNKGYVMDLDAGTTTNFECEQGKDTVVFTFEGANSTSMAMSMDGKGNPVGTINGVTYVFVDPEIEAEHNKSFTDDPYVGTYHMENSQRGTMSIDLNGDTYTVTIDWLDFNSTANNWTFTGQFNGRGVLNYNNCVKNIITYSADGIPNYEQAYTNGSGYIQIAEEGTKTGFTWSDDAENAGAGVLFIKD